MGITVLFLKDMKKDIQVLDQKVTVIYGTIKSMQL